MGFVAYHQVPAAVGRPELLLHLLVAGEFVEPGDGEVVLEEPVAGTGGFELVVGEDLEGKVKAPVEFVLPLLGEAAGADNQAALEITARDQLLDEEPGHDRLAGARVVGEQEAQGLARQHRLVDRGDLVGQRLHEGGVDREQRIEQVGEADAVGFSNEAEGRAVAVEAPRPADLDDLQARLVVAVEDLVRHPPVGPAVNEGQRVRAVPGDVDDGDRRVGQNASDGGVGLELFEAGHGWRGVCRTRSIVAREAASNPDRKPAVGLRGAHNAAPSPIRTTTPAGAAPRGRLVPLPRGRAGQRPTRPWQRRRSRVGRAPYPHATPPRHPPATACNPVVHSPGATHPSAEPRGPLHPPPESQSAL